MPGDIEQLLKAIGQPRRLLIVTHDNPDPDAFVSACALARLVEAASRVKSRICCEGIVGRAENRALARALRLKLMDASRVNWKKWPRIALVDSQPWTGNNSLPARRVPDVVLDHHPLMSRTRARFLDVRPEYGACATLMAEHLQAASVPIPSDLASGFCYAIASETRDLSESATQADVAAYLRLFPTADKRLLSRIHHPRLKQAYFAIMARAVLGAFTYSNIIGAHLGEIDHPDSVSLVADLLLRHERIGWAIATGRYKGDLYVSLRTTSGQAHAGQLLRRLLGKRGRAGGHGTTAGGKVPLAGMGAAERERLPNGLVLRLIHILRRRDDVELKPLVATEELHPGCRLPRPDV